jgi:hypothetical protein
MPSIAKAANRITALRMSSSFFKADIARQLGCWRLPNLPECYTNMMRGSSATQDAVAKT